MIFCNLRNLRHCKFDPVIYSCSYLSTLAPVHLLLSLIYHRLFGGKPSKQAPVTTAENMKNSTVISNPHATMNHVATVLESPDAGLGGGDSETSSPLFGGRALGSGMGTLGSEQVRRKQWRQWMSVNLIYK